MTEAGQAAALAHVDRPAPSDVELLCSQRQIHLGLHLHNHAPAAAMEGLLPAPISPGLLVSLVLAARLPDVVSSRKCIRDHLLCAGKKAPNITNESVIGKPLIPLHCVPTVIEPW